MKYQDILPDVLAGKIVRQSPDLPWMRMKRSGMWDIDDEHSPETVLKKEAYLVNTWEVKPQEIYVWGVCHKSGKSEIYSKEPVHGSPRDWVSDQASEWLEFGGEKNLFPKDRPQKFKLIPVNEEEKVYRYKYSAVLNETYSSGEEYMCKKYGPGYWDAEFKPQQVIDAFWAGKTQ